MKHVSLRTFDSDGIISSLCAGGFYEFFYIKSFYADKKQFLEGYGF